MYPFFGIESRQELMQLFARNGLNAEQVLPDESSKSIGDEALVH